VIEVEGGGTSEWFIEPAELGIEEAGLEAIAGGDPEENAATARAILAGEQGPAADVAVVNAGAAIYVGGGAADLAAGVEAARAAIDTGAAAEVLRGLTAMRATGQ
jgi:anthranilate phosphoribosyltransferase